MRPSVLGLAGLLALAVLLGQGTARAETDSARAGARATATEGLHAIKQERWADAIALFQRAESLVHAPPHLLHIARAYVRLGKLVQAREAYLKIIHEDLPASAPKAFVEAKSAAAEERTALEGRVASLTISLRGPHADNAAVTMDGAEIAPPLIGVPFPADPGSHTLRATSPGWSSDDTKVDLAEGGKQSVALTLTHEAAVAGKSAGPVEEGRPKLRTGGFIALGVGAVGVGIGTVFLLRNKSLRSDVNALCPTAACPAANREQITSLDDSGDTAATISWVGYGVGAAGLITGATLLFLGRRPGHAETAVSVHPWIGAGSGGVAGRF